MLIRPEEVSERFDDTIPTRDNSCISTPLLCRCSARVQLIVVYPFHGRVTRSGHALPVRTLHNPDTIHVNCRAVALSCWSERISSKPKNAYMYAYIRLAVLTVGRYSKCPQLYDAVEFEAPNSTISARVAHVADEDMAREVGPNGVSRLCSPRDR